VLDQLTSAEFITSGAYDRHVRAARLRYRRRRDQLVSALASRPRHLWTVPLQ
jgi:GntR family transcriptional regulator/MocR family aminotransferase